MPNFLHFCLTKTILKFTVFILLFDNFANLDLIENVKKLPSVKDNTNNKERDKSKAVNDSKNDTLNKDKNEVKIESENENILFLRFLTASLCEVLISKYGHDILNGETRLAGAVIA